MDVPFVDTLALVPDAVTVVRSFMAFQGKKKYQVYTKEMVVVSFLTKPNFWKFKVKLHTML